MDLADWLIVSGSIGLIVSAGGLFWGLQRRTPRRRR